MTVRLAFLSTGFYAMTVACSGASPSDPSGPGVEPPGEIEAPPESTGDPLPAPPGPEEHDEVLIGTRGLASAFPSDAELVGVTVDPETQELYVLDAVRGLYRLIDDQAGELVFDMADAPLLPSAFTDVVALGGRRFALTAVNDGFLLNLATGQLTQHFCYFPETGPDSPPQSISDDLTRDGVLVLQRTESVAFSREFGLLYAQPQTIDEQTGAVLGSELATFDVGTGEDLRWVAMPNNELLAGGMVAWRENVVLGLPDGLWLMGEGLWRRFVRSSEVGFSRVDGMSVSANGTLLVLDSAQRTLFEVRAP